MAEDNEDIELVIEPDKTPEGEIEITHAEKPAKIMEPEEGLETLKTKLDEEREALRREREAHAETQRREQEATNASVTAKNEVQDTNRHFINNVIETVKQSNAILKANYKVALEAQDHDALYDIQQEMATNAAKMLKLEDGKQALESQPKVTAPRPTNTVEDFASSLSPRSAAWVRSHPECVTNPRMNQGMLSAHNLAMLRGIEADTDAYFEYVESNLGMRQKPQADDVLADAAKITGGRNIPPASAPPSRTGTITGQPSNRVTLSAQEREMADMMDMTPEAYAKQKLALQREGKLQ